MLDFKIFVDSLASLASIVAIVMALIGWYRSARKPLKIIRVIVHRKKNSMTFILVTQNRQPYPVRIQHIHCFKRKIYEVKKKTAGKPEYSELLSFSDAVFIDSSSSLVPASANTDLRFEVDETRDIPNRLLFSIDTSHGYHELWCNDVTVVDMEVSEAYSIEYKKNYDSKIKAHAVYFWKSLEETCRNVVQRRKPRG